MAEIALRWISHHSLLKREYGDAVLIGASSTKHIEQNLIDLEKGPLRECYALDYRIVTEQIDDMGLTVCDRRRLHS